MQVKNNLKIIKTYFLDILIWLLDKKETASKLDLFQDSSNNNGFYKIIKIKYKGTIDELPLGMNLIEKAKDEATINIDEDKIKLTDSIIYLSNEVEVEDLEVSNTPVDDMVANLYREYQIQIGPPSAVPIVLSCTFIN